MKKSAGILLYRQPGTEYEILLVHPGGPFWGKKDAGVWSVPKGEFGDDEEPLAAAKREFYEETGIQLPEGNFIPLTPVRQRSGKLVFSWLFPFDLDAGMIKSNLFEMEWPPHSGMKKQFPEVDRAEWFTFSEARMKINPGQLPLIDECERILSK